MPELTGTVPVLRSFDEARTRAFYVGFLGFKVDWMHRFDPTAPLYMQVSRDGVILHLSEHHGDGTPGSTVFVTVRDIAALHAELRGKDYPNMRPGIEAMPWGTREMRVIDPSGNMIRFSEPSE